MARLDGTITALGRHRTLVVLAAVPIAFGLIGVLALTGAPRPTRSPVPSTATAAAAAPPSVLRVVEATPGATARPQTPTAPTTIVEAGVAGSEDPVPTPPPYQYSVPAAVPLVVRRIYAMDAFTQGIATYTLYGPLDGANQPQAGTRGITVSIADGATTHPCGPNEGGGRQAVSADPATFLHDLRTVARVGIRPETETTLDGHPALVADVDSASNGCTWADYHPGGMLMGHVSLTFPSRLIVSQIAGRTIVVQIWAPTPADLETWLPLAQRVVDTFRFADRP